MSDVSLSEERDFLLGSLDDLDAEFAAGDLDRADYEALRADYTARAAAVLRRIEGQPGAVPRDPTPDRTGGDRWWWVVGVVALAAVAGVLVAGFSGSRSAGESITGDIRVTARELLRDAQVAFADGDLEGAIAHYDEVLELQPSNVEALTYKAWFTRLLGDPAAAAPLVEDAVAIDPDYADARVFAASIALELGDVGAARSHLDAFDALSAPPFLEQLVAQQGLRARLGEAVMLDAFERVGPVLLIEDPPPFAETGLSVADVLAAAEFVASDDVFAAVTLVQRALDDAPDDPDLLAGYAWLLSRSATPSDPSPAELALPFLDRALQVAPDHPEALIYRAFTRAFLGDIAGGGTDLDAFDALPVRPADLRELVTVYGLRDQLGR